MKSTPVRFSSARMLRPSRPMMRPFMSSAGSWTTDTVVSAAWPAAMRCITTARMLRTRRSASRLVSSSIRRTRRAESWRIWSSSSRSSSCLACDALRPATRSRSRTCRSRAAASSSSRTSRPWDWVSRLAMRFSSASSRVNSRSSRRTSSARRCLSSASPAAAAAAASSAGWDWLLCGGAAGAGRVAVAGDAAACGAAARPGIRRCNSVTAPISPITRPSATTTAAITMSMVSHLPEARPGPGPRSRIKLLRAADRAVSGHVRRDQQKAAGWAAGIQQADEAVVRWCLGRRSPGFGRWSAVMSEAAGSAKRIDLLEFQGLIARSVACRIVVPQASGCKPVTADGPRNQRHVAQESDFT